MGSLGLGAERLLSFRKAAQIDWRSELWRFLVRTPCDFDGYDRRFMHAGLYLDEFSGESVRVHLAIDTSGSIGESELSVFMAEVSGILGSYPHVVCYLYYADADLYGPWVLGRGDAPPKPKGGGGTSFVPFFERVKRDEDADVTDLLVYLTDGYGSFPSAAPEQTVLWVVTPGGLASPEFPFGSVVRLS
jgi:predicted metal-dependent peptidase